jgi:branched-chain amino acid transport system permease protein
LEGKKIMKFWVSCVLAGVLFLGFSMSSLNEYLFFAGFVVLQFVVLATAWNILGGYAGYVNFGVSAFVATGSYTAVVLFKAYQAPLLVQLLGGAIMAGLMGLGVGLLTLKLRGIFFSIATVAVVFIMALCGRGFRHSVNSSGSGLGIRKLHPVPVFCHGYTGPDLSFNCPLHSGFISGAGLAGCA